MDRLTQEQRRKTMQAVMSKNSMIEQSLRHALWKRGRRYRTNYGRLPGKPDIVFLGARVAIFCDSEFWHGYDWENRKFDIKSRREYWFPKIERNIARDKQVTSELEEAGWTVLRFWGRQIEKDLDGCVGKVEEAVSKQRSKLK